MAPPAREFPLKSAHGFLPLQTLRGELRGSITLGLLFSMGSIACEATPTRSPRPPLQPSVERNLTHPERTAALPPPRPIEDRGIFPEYNDRIDILCPSWLSGGPATRVRWQASSRTWLAFDGIVLCQAQNSDEGAPLLSLDGLVEFDEDRDNIIDSVDLLRGVKKTLLNGAKYQSGYVEIPFPEGDLPRTQGVCTDVVIRALRNAGFDLQKLVQEDIKKRPRAYPMVRTADPNIDHRRVRTLLPFFEARFQNLPPSPVDSAFPYFPGDIVFMNTMGDGEPEHMGIVSDRLGDSGLPLVVNNWNDGSTTSEMDLLNRVPVTHRFRIARPIAPPKEDRGLGGLLRRHGLQLPVQSRQVLSVTAPLWNSSGGVLRRYEKVSDDFQIVGDEIPVRLGSAGLGWGIGLPIDADDANIPGAKKEGDRRSPAGVFGLGTAFGTTEIPPYQSRWTYRRARMGDFWVDDPLAAEYNTWQSLPPGEKTPWSAERLTMYSLALVVQYNTEHPAPGAGSAIFLHPWKSPASTTVGCTSMEAGALKTVLTWLDPEAQPVLLQVAGRIY